MPSWIVTSDDARPAGKPGECFYCQTPIGQEHRVGCVMRCVPVVAYIRKNSTGEVRACGASWLADNPSPYIWAEGNYRCDCNRHLFFSESDSEEDFNDYPCGETAYTVLKIVLEDGTIVYTENS
mgnify:CR=1 FL=1